MIFNYSQFSKIFEGGAAIKSSRPILQKEAGKTLAHMENVLFPLLGNGKFDKDYILIGSLGKKKNPEDSSGDIDLGISKDFLTDKFGVSGNQILSFLYEKLKKELPEILGYEPEMKLMPGLNVLSVEWPIEADPANGTVQLDLIPLSDMDWAKFIFYSPDYRKNESSYKSAHRNWLFQAILSALKKVKDRDDDGNILDFDSYVLRLSDGIFKNSKSFSGVTKRLARAKILPGSEEFITKDPQQAIELMFGPGYKPDDFKTFEDTWKVVTSKEFIHADKIGEIANDLIRYLNNGNFEIPIGVEKYTTNETP